MTNAYSHMTKIEAPTLTAEVLIFEPANDPVPLNPDGAVDPLKVTAVRIVAVEDYHD